MKIRARSGEIIDLEDVRKDAQMMSGYGIGNPYSVDMAIMVKHNVALLDALEAACGVPPETAPVGFGVSSLGLGRNAALRAVREAAGVIEEPV